MTDNREPAMCKGVGLNKEGKRVDCKMKAYCARFTDKLNGANIYLKYINYDNTHGRCKVIRPNGKG